MNPRRPLKYKRKSKVAEAFETVYHKSISREDLHMKVYQYLIKNGITKKERNVVAQVQSILHQIKYVKKRGRWKGYTLIEYPIFRIERTTNSSVYG